MDVFYFALRIFAYRPHIGAAFRGKKRKAIIHGTDETVHNPRSAAPVPIHAVAIDVLGINSHNLNVIEYSIECRVQLQWPGSAFAHERNTPDRQPLYVFCC